MRRYFILLVLAIAAVIAPISAPCDISLSPGDDDTDYIEADTGTYTSGDKLELTGNVVFHTESAFRGLTVEVRADSAVWDEKASVFAVHGCTTVTILEYDLTLTGTDLVANLVEKTGSMRDVAGSVRIDPELFADETGLIDRRYARFRNEHPRVHLIGGDLEFYEDSGGVLLFEFHHARITTTEPDDADLVLSIKRLLYAPNEFLSARGVRVQARGVSVGYVPRFKTKLRKGQGLVSLTVPLPGHSDDDGFYIKQATYLDAGKVSADIYSNYYSRNDEFWVDTFVYTDPSENSRIGAHFGRNRTADRWEERVGKTTRYDFYGWQRVELDWPFVQQVVAGANIAKIKQDAPEITSRSNHGYLELTTPAFRLGHDIRLLAAFGAHYYDYSFGDNEFLALRSRIKLAKSTPWGIDSVEFAHADKFGGSPFRFDDNFPENLLTATKNFQALPHLTGRVSVAYDFDLEHFDSLIVGLNKEFGSYYLGLNYDFARGSTGVEAALKF
ncbi:hypothetical protein J7J84_08565 [bacterium]|nr:hypothetical protein [bacterium]